MKEELGFWLAVMLVSVAGVALFKLGAASSLGDRIPAYRDLAAFV
jgi:hypothetical protein